MDLTNIPTVVTKPQRTISIKIVRILKKSMLNFVRLPNDWIVNLRIVRFILILNLLRYNLSK